MKKVTDTQFILFRAGQVPSIGTRAICGLGARSGGQNFVADATVPWRHGVLVVALRVGRCGLAGLESQLR